MDKFKQYQRVIRHAKELMVSGAGDCSCEYSHFGCSTMEFRHGAGILDNILKLKRVDDLTDKVLVTGCEPYLYKNQFKTKLNELS